MNDNVYLMYYGGNFIGLLTDSDAFYYLNDYMSEGDEPFNVVIANKDSVSLPDNLGSFGKLVQNFCSVELCYAKVNLGVEYDDSLV